MAIEASNLTEKDELISKFYTIRAGLSVIAEETGKIRSLENEIQTLKREDNNYKEKRKKELENGSSRLNSEKWKIEYNLKDTKEKLEKARKEKSEIDGRVYDNSAFILPLFLTIALAIVSFIIMMIVVSVNEDYFETAGTSGELLFFFLLIVLPIIVGIIAYRINKRKFNAINNNIRKEKHMEYDSQISALEGEINSAEQRINEIDQIVNGIENQDIPALQSFSLNADEVSKLEQELTLMRVKCNEKVKKIKIALIKEYGAIITEDDWGNIDLLIFYLNTGRADSLKEALQLVDQQRQTNQIVRAIGTAASYISNTMQENIYRLSGAMNNCFSSLNNQIKTNSQEFVRAINDMNNSVNAQLDSVESTVRVQSNALIEAQELNASLLKEANRSSEDLMNELRYNQRYWVK